MKLKLDSAAKRRNLMATSVLAGVAAFGVPAMVMTAATLAPSAAFAQDFSNGNLVGRVTNDAGAPVAGAKVTARSPSTGVVRTATTDAQGNYAVPQAPIGAYTVTVSAAGYADSTQQAQLNVGNTTTYDFTIAAPGRVSEVVVTATRRGAGIDFNQTTTGAVVNVQQTFDRIPLGRNVNSIVELAPGTTSNTVFGQPSIAGSSSAENIYYVNGFNVTNFRNLLGGATIPFNFYDQVDVKTGGYAAEFGRATGGAVIAVTRSGSNEFHGGADVSWQPTSIQSTAPRVNINSAPLGTGYYPNYSYSPPADNYESDYWVSGPIIKDHLFVYAFYNQRHFENQANTDSGDKSYTRQNTLRDDPFYGTKVDFNLTSKQRLEATYFKDNENALINYTTVDTTGAATNSKTNAYSGGEVKIFRYTGNWTDWFTLSMLYGENRYNQTTAGDLDSQASVYTPTGGLVRGNPALLISKGEDERKQFRIDGDFYFNLLGRHHTRIGYDKENLRATIISSYSGGVYYRYYGANTNCGGSGVITNNCVRVRDIETGGTFSIINQGYYIEDTWDVTDRLNLQLGVRDEDFDNRNALKGSFFRAKDQFAPRIGASYDLFGDRSTKVTAFYGRYYLPIPANTNTRESGAESFREQFYIYTAQNPTTLVPTLGTEVTPHDSNHPCLEGTNTGTKCVTTVPAAGVIAALNAKSESDDEFSIGVEHKFTNGWKLGSHVTYRLLNQALEDTNLNYTTACAYLAAQNNISTASCGNFGSSGYIITNPGKDAQIRLDSSWGALANKVVTLPSSVIGLPKAKREYYAVDLTFERPWDGKWQVDGSVTISKDVGNYEGGVKSDNGQADTGITQDFDERGWVDGSYGLLPNHHAYTFKLHGTYQIIDNLKAGTAVNIVSPRHYGCIGYYPLTDGRADASTATAWYCNGTLTPRGSQFTGDWVGRVDANLVYDVPVHIIPGKFQVRIDVFNLFDSQSVDIYQEFGETGGPKTLTSNYKQPLNYQTPRTVRIGASYRF